MNVAKCKRRMGFILNTGMFACLHPTHHCLYMHYHMINYLAIYDCEKQVLSFEVFVSCSTLNAATDSCTNCGSCPPGLLQFHAYCQHLKAQFSPPKSHARIVVKALDMVGC